MTQQTPLHATHVAAGARMVDFAGWDMPVNYGSQIEEHHAVRRDAGMFDVSHMLALDLEGADAKAFLRGLIANDVAKLVEPGKALYACMLNEQGGVIDDLIEDNRLRQYERQGYPVLAPTMRGRGAGQKLMKAALDHAASWPGLRQVYLGVNAVNQPAIRLYERMGFATYGREPACMIVNGEAIDELLMVWILDDGRWTVGNGRE